MESQLLSLIRRDKLVKEEMKRSRGDIEGDGEGKGGGGDVVIVFEIPATVAFHMYISVMRLVHISKYHLLSI